MSAVFGSSPHDGFANIDAIETCLRYLLACSLASQRQRNDFDCRKSIEAWVAHCYVLAENVGKA
jgi:hypothetical protein